MIRSGIVLAGLLVVFVLWRAAFPQKQREPEKRDASVSPKSAGVRTGSGKNIPQQESIKTDSIDCLEQLNRGRRLSDALWLSEFQACAQVRPADALRWAIQNAPSKSRLAACEFAITAWTVIDPRSAANFAELEVQNPYLRGHLLKTVSRAWFSSDPEQTKDWILRLSNTVDRVSVSAAILDTIDAWDTSLSWRLIEVLPESKLRKKWLQSLAEHWAGTDLQGAISWLAGLSEKEWPPAADQILPTLARMDPVQCIAFLRSSGDRLSSETKLGILKELAASDSSAALKWAKEFDAEESGRALRIVIAIMGRNDPREAARLSTTLFSQDDQLAVGVDIAAQWAKGDLRSASEWVNRFPPTEPLKKAIILLAKEALQDLSSAESWIGSLQSPDYKDSAISEIVEVLSASRPDLASEWSLKISKESERNRRLLEAYDRWHDMAPIEATAWLEQTTLKKEIKDRLIQLTSKK